MTLLEALAERAKGKTLRSPHGHEYSDKRWHGLVIANATDLLQDGWSVVEEKAAPKAELQEEIVEVAPFDGTVAVPGAMGYVLLHELNGRAWLCEDPQTKRRSRVVWLDFKYERNGKVEYTALPRIYWNHLYGLVASAKEVDDIVCFPVAARFRVTR